MKNNLTKIQIIGTIIIPILFSCSQAQLPPPHIHTDLQASFLAGHPQDITNYANGDKELSRPIWSQIKVNNPQGENATYTFEYKSSDNLDQYIMTTKDTNISFTNLMINKHYTYSVKCNGKIIQEGEFDTEDSIIRNLYVDGVTNVRDMGGYQTIEGKRVKQGLMFRSAALTNPPYYCITNDGIRVMLNQLHIKSEIDLRNEIPSEFNYSVLGPSVNFYNVRMYWRWTPDQSRALRKEALEVFHLFADLDNYPIDFHCWVGSDRTGLIGVLLDGLLGLKEEDIYYDYLFSNFGIVDNFARVYSNVNTYYLNYINTFPGNNIIEKVTNYLTNDLDEDDDPLDIEEVNKIRSKMLED